MGSAERVTSQQRWAYRRCFDSVNGRGWSVEDRGDRDPDCSVGGWKFFRSAQAGQKTRRGSWLLTSLPGMGLLTWSCDPGKRGYLAYRLTFDPSASTATETVTMTVRGQTLLSRTLNPPWKAVPFPLTKSPVRRVIISQATEPGTLRAIVTVNFKGTPTLPSHCWPYLPPAMTVTLKPR